MMRGVDGEGDRIAAEQLFEISQLITPHPVPLPMGEGTTLQRLRPDSLSHWERAGVRGDALDLRQTSLDGCGGNLNGDVPFFLQLLFYKLRICKGRRAALPDANVRGNFPLDPAFARRG